MPILVEACVDSVASAVAAERGGARRLELCDNLADAGTTPSAGMIAAVKAHVGVPVFPIVRARGGGFVYSPLEVDVMRRDIRAARRFFATVLRDHGEPTEVVTDRAPALRAVIDELIPAAFHNTAQYANNRIEADHGQLKRRLREDL